MIHKEMPSTPSDDRLGQQMMTIDEVARLLNVHTNTVRQWNHRGLLNAYRLGPRGDRRFTEKDVLDFLTNGNNGNGSDGDEDSIEPASQ
ncbi:MAG: helix-turn-helix domain-containing protein [Chloroflexi bacterium]|nr:helix-turn-helix domain-containing protein [Chloroflexota bacterium]